MSIRNCLDTLDEIKDNISLDEYYDLKDECYGKQPSLPPMDFQQVPLNNDLDNALAIGALGAAGAVAIGGAAAIGITAIFGMTALTAIAAGNAPSNVTTAFQRDSNGNVTSQTTTVT
jgi:hypothetical protein